MNPAAIIYVMHDEEVRMTIDYALTKNVAIAVRTGGDQYSGASSTGGENIQLYMSEGFKDIAHHTKKE